MVICTNSKEKSFLRDVKLAGLGLVIAGGVAVYDVIGKTEAQTNKVSQPYASGRTAELATERAKMAAERECTGGSYALGKPTPIFSISPTRTVPFFNGYVVNIECRGK